MREALRWATGAFSVAFLFAAFSTQSEEVRTKDFNVPAQSATTGIPEFARQASIQILVSESLVRGKQTTAVTGLHTVEEGLTVLLRGTGLIATSRDGATYTLAEPRGGISLDRSAPNVPAGDRGKSSSSSHEASDTALAEIIVTAEKRSERLQDVPVPVTVLDANALAEQNQNRLQDYFATVPGLNLSAGSGGGGTQTLAIRGITTGNATNPTVGVTIDDVPYGSSTVLGLAGLLYPDIDPSDLARIEVLRGPQGTLYGASSIGGLVKFVSADPSTDAVSGRVQVLGDTVQHGDAGYGVRGAINVPISDTLAIRASAFTRRDPGYVDNVTTRERDVNQADVFGGRISALWRPSDTLSLKLSAMAQNTDGDGAPLVDTNSGMQPTLGDLAQARMPGTGEYHIRADLFTANLTAKLGGVDITSITGYSINKFNDSEDASQLIGGCCAEPVFGVTGSAELNDFETRKFTEELRLSSAIGHEFEWLAGGFFTHENTSVDQKYTGNDPTTGIPLGVLIDLNDPNTVSEYALFADLTVHFTDKFDVQFGGRESHNKQTYRETDTGPGVPIFDFGVPSPAVTPQEDSKDNSFTYLVTPRFKITPDLMLYARFASGYRVGGPNYIAALSRVPLTYGPDKTNNYELGIKGNLFDRALTFDASAYYIDWRHIQLYLFNPTTFGTYYANGGNAKSQGLEASVQARPIHGMTLGASASLIDAVLTQDFPATANAIGTAGDRLPYSARLSGSLSVDQDMALTARWTGFVGALFSYVGARQGEFATPYSPNAPNRVLFPPYGELNLHAGARSDSWTLSLFANNVANRRGMVGGGYGYAESAFDAVYIQPRTVGLSATKTF